MTANQKIDRLHTRTVRYGLTRGETAILRRAQMVLHRWAERECNGEIERGESRPEICHDGRGNRVPDLETPALKRIEKIVTARNARFPDRPALRFYHQRDPRGCAVYLVPADVIPEGKSIAAYYSRGLAICD